MTVNLLLSALLMATLVALSLMVARKGDETAAAIYFCTAILYGLLAVKL